VTMLSDALVKRGVKIDGRLRTVKARSGGSIVPQPDGLMSLALLTNIPQPPASVIEIASLQSPSFHVIAASTLKPSQNLYTEIILRTLGKMRSIVPSSNESNVSRPSETSEESGLKVVGEFLRQAGVGESELSLNDGSGLS